MKLARLLGLVLLVAPVLASASPLDGFLAAVESRAGDPSLTRQERRTLFGARDLLRQRGLLGSEVAWARRAAQRLGGRSVRGASFEDQLADLVSGGRGALRSGGPREHGGPRGPFAGDPEIAAAEAAAADELEAALRDDRDVLTARRGTLGDAAAERRLSAGLGAADRALRRVASGGDLLARFGALASAARHLRDAYPPQPAFSSVDANTASATYGQYVSPRDRAGFITGWYFSHAT